MLTQQTFSQISDEFILERTSRGRTPRTVKLYQSELSYFVEWLKQKNYDEKVHSLTPSILREWFSKLGETRNKGGVHSNYRIIKACLNWYDFEYEPTWKNPMKKVKIQLPKNPPLEEIPLTEVQKLLDVCSDGYFHLRDISILKLLVDTGARASELLSLNIGNIDLKTGRVEIIKGKGSKYRITWLGKKSLKTLKDYLNTRKDAKPEDPLFINSKGNRLKFFGLRALLKRLCHRANIKDYAPHCFRRVCALTLWRKTHDIEFVRRYMGHSSTEVTKRYLNLSNEDLRESFLSASPADLLD